MAVFKCKMCGGSLDISDSVSVATCEYCGTKQTVPKSEDEVVSNLFNRANNLRLKCEFDKAEQVYEKILDIDNTDSEAHWGIVLCKYGIEYVEDPQTLKRIPTCHRTSFEAVTTDVDYLAAVDYSDAAQQLIYESEARAIDRIQKDILAIVKNEKPFDVFLCYKETDENGKRTIDSAITNDIYYQLTQEGFKVFYAPITLEDKLGHEYEPYIFAALNSAKVMLVVGTKPEYFDAVWVRNEWSRFLKIMKTDRTKLLIPCYRDMDAYELPNEFAHLQAQDMGKIGFISDVIRGLKKVMNNDEPTQPEVDKRKIKNTSKFKKAIKNFKRKRMEKAKYCLAFPLKNISKIFYIVSIVLNSYLFCKILSLNTDIELWTSFLSIQLFSILMPTLIILKKSRNKVLSILIQSISAFACLFLCLGFGDIYYIIEEGLYLFTVLITLSNVPWLIIVCFSKKVEKVNIKKSRKLKTALISGLISLIFILFFEFGGATFCDYQLAKLFSEFGAHGYANEYYLYLDDYKDSADLATKAKLAEIKNAGFMDEVCLGNWVEGNSIYGGTDVDWWYVIAKENNKVLLLSQNRVSKSDNPDIVGGWENSSLRKFLNGEYYKLSFDEHMKDHIITAQLKNSSNPEDTTTDKIFILSKEEVEKYFPTIYNRENILANEVLRNVHNNIYSYINDKGIIEKLEYTNIPVLDTNEDGTISHRKLSEYLQKYGKYIDINAKIENSSFHSAMWIDVSDLE